MNTVKTVPSTKKPENMTAKEWAEVAHKATFDAVYESGMFTVDEANELANAVYKTSMFRANNPFMRLMK